MQNAAKVSSSARRSSCYHTMPMEGHMLHCLGSHCICRCFWPSMDVFLRHLFPQVIGDVRKEKAIWLMEGHPLKTLENFNCLGITAGVVCLLS